MIDQLWTQDWARLDFDQPCWFLHSFFRPETELSEFLKKHSAEAGLPDIPDEFELPNGCKIRPYVDYFYPWQALALVDVVCAADIFETIILNSPDVEARVANATRTAALMATLPSKPVSWLDTEVRWGGLSSLMTWLAHYQAMKEHSNSRTSGVLQEENTDVLRDRARKLAEHLNVDPVKMEALVKSHLLTTAQWWSWGSKRHKRLRESVFPHLQHQVYLAVEWLCLLTENTLDHYFDLWRYQDRQTQQWAELRAVLPFEYFSAREKFLELTPYYLKDFNARLEPKFQLEGAALLARVDLIRTRNRHFNRLTMAFKNLHDEMAGNLNDRALIDFRERDPLAHYLLVAICAEKCFREELTRIDKLKDIKPEKEQGMFKYLLMLVKSSGFSHQATIAGLNEGKNKKISQLHDTPENVISQIRALSYGEAGNELPLAQAMICCEVARNYFAHHDYLDDKLLEDADSRFLLGGILMAVLTLLGQ